MPYPAKAVANEFLHLAKDEGRPLTPMQLLKLVYFAYGWYWAIANDRLLDERVEAWKYGPVVPSIYHEFKRFGNEAINDFATELIPRRKEDGKFTFFLEEPRVPECDELPKQLIRRVWDVYKGYSAIQLSRMTHEPGTPWAETPDKDVKGTDIDDQKIRNYFVHLAARQNVPQPA
jgi:uncharacterized phage-associated protein